VLVKKHFFRATTYFINRKSSYNNKKIWKLENNPGGNIFLGNSADRIIKDRKIQSYPRVSCTYRN
jgi:hypothetical protein